ncbi:MAG TPA: hypothetical protein VHV32_17610 [Candidatus Angelobacter sp.]|jgi:hypothetical protein|nr:hypothetical protein [Candidatus Angelobacter sp.]
MMQTQAKSINKKLRVSGALIALGLLVQALSLLWNHPLSFIAYVTIGGLFVAGGIVLYLFTLVNIPSGEPGDDTSPKAQTQNTLHSA